MARLHITQLVRNDVVFDTAERRFRILDVTIVRPAAAGAADMGAVATGHAWLFPMDEAHGAPQRFSLGDLEECFSIEPETLGVEPTISGDSKQRPVKPRKVPTQAQLRVANRAYNRICSLINEPGIFEASSRHALLQKYADTHRLGTPKTLLKDLRRWWRGGQTIDALLGGYDSCGRRNGGATGGRGRRRWVSVPHEQLLSQPREALGHSTDDSAGLEAPDGEHLALVHPYQLTATDIQHMREVVEQYYFDTRTTRTLTRTLQELHERFYTYIDGNGQRCLKPSVECPSYRQLHYFVHSNYSLEVRTRRRLGDAAFALQHRSTEGSIQVECHGAGHIYEFDATILDLPLVSSRNRANIIGKPTLYLIIDRHSRLIVGWYLGLENPNYSAAMLAILSIGQDKRQLCKDLDLPFDEADWPADRVLPEVFLADQGELVHKQARRIARSMRATIANVPGLRPDWKPLVECGFAMLHQIISPDTPGFTPDRENRQRRAINRSRDIAMDMNEATRLIVSAIIAHNKSPQKSYPLTPEQASAGVRPIPRELWQDSIRFRTGRVDRMDFERVREELLPRGTATVTEDGIKYAGVYYSADVIREHGWLVEGRKHRMKLEVAFDYRLVDHIFVYPPKGDGPPCQAELVGDSLCFKGMSFEEVRQHFAQVNDIHRASSEEKRQALFEHHQRTQPMIEAARRETKKAVVGVSRSTRRVDTLEERQRELRKERSRTALIPEGPSTTQHVPSAQAMDKGAPQQGDSPPGQRKSASNVLSLSDIRSRARTDSAAPKSDEAAAPPALPMSAGHAPRSTSPAEGPDVAATRVTQEGQGSEVTAPSQANREPATEPPVPAKTVGKRSLAERLADARRRM